MEEELEELGLSVLEGVSICWGTERAGKDQSSAGSPRRAEPMEALSLGHREGVWIACSFC